MSADLICLSASRVQNWNNVWTQGITILATSTRDDADKAMWQAQLTQAVKYWSDCYMDGTSVPKYGWDFCQCVHTLCQHFDERSAQPFA